MNNPELLKTKLAIPPVRRELVARPHLFARLDESLSGKLTLVSAPAGYGKTTLLSAWSRQLGLPVAWLSLDEGDNDPARFLGHLCASIEAAVPSLAGRLQELAQPDRFGGLGAAGSTEAVQTALLNRLQSVPHSLMVVLDDFHLISVQPVHRLVAFLVDNLPPQMHLVIASRADPPLPLARLRARSQLVEIRQSDLRFGSDEAIAFLNQLMGLGLEAGDVTALVSRTEGWIAGLHLAATSVQGRGDAHRFIQEFKGSNRYILDYLVEEVLQRQPPDVQSFLLQTSILDRMTGPLCDAVTEQRGGQAVLEMLERANLFILPLDDEREWYRYHRLFADLLRKRLGEAGTEFVAALHRRASGWEEQNGFPAEAIDHSLAAKDFARAARLIEGIAAVILMRSEVATLHRWLDALPEAELRVRPSLSLYYAWMLLLRGSPLDLVEERLAWAEGHPTPLTLPLRAWIAHYRGDLAAAVELSRRALEQLPEDEAFLRGLAALSLAAVHHIDGDFAASQRVLQEAALGSRHAGDVATTVYAAYYQAEHCRREGELQRARSLFMQALDLATDHGGHRLPIACQVLKGLGEIAREWNDLDTAERYLLEGVELAEGWAQAGAVDAYVTLARVRQARGDWSGAQGALQAGRLAAAGVQATDIIERALEASEAWLQIMQRDPSLRPGEALEGPRSWAERRGLAGDIDPLVLVKDDDVTLRRIRKYEYPVAARLRIAEGRPAEALALMELALPIVEKMNRIVLVIEYQMLIALAEQALGQNGRALRSLDRALALAEPGGFVRIFVDEGRPMARLLYEAASEGMRPEYVGRLLAAFPASHQPTSYQPSAPSTEHPMIEALSERELEVLRLVAEGLSNEEIAQRLVVSLTTIKFHTSNIYGKLSAKNRTEAVAKARAISLLPLS